MQSFEIARSPKYPRGIGKVDVELKERGLSTAGSRDKLEQRLIDDEFERHDGIMPRSDISHWSISHSEKYILQPVAIHLCPYNPTYWESRAYCQYQQSFYDLAIGDAYHAQLLCDVLERAPGRNKRPGLYPRIWHAIVQHLLVEPREDGKLKPEDVRLRQAI